MPRILRLFRNSSRSLIARLASSSEKKVRLRRGAITQRSTCSTADSTLALSLGFPARAGMTTEP